MGLDIRGYTVAQWKRKQRKMEVKDHLSQAFSSQVSSEGVVHFSAASETRRGEGREEAIDISKERDMYRGQSTVSVDITS